jgi:ribosomal protein L12E/L44/L45/RPP1/RPP2
MTTRNPFYEQWRECLRTHYKFVVQQNDTSNEKSLETVLVQVGFTPDDIRLWRRELLGYEATQDEELTLPPSTHIEAEETPAVAVQAVSQPVSQPVIEPAPIETAISEPQMAELQIAQDGTSFDAPSPQTARELGGEANPELPASAETPIEVPSAPIVPRAATAKKDSKSKKDVKKDKRAEKPDENDQMSLF